MDRAATKDGLFLGFYFNMRKTIVVKSLDELEVLISNEIEKFGVKCDLNHIDVSHITSMSGLFYDSKFNGDISRWDVSNVENMRYMFGKSQFNTDVSKWDVSRVIFADSAFEESRFNQNISKWNTKSLKYAQHMFSGTMFDGDISGWDTRELINISKIFFDNEENAPYWALIEDKKKRDEAVALHQLNKTATNNAK